MDPHQPTPIDASWMHRALALARMAWGQTHPNPMVGCVIACGETLLAEGWHHRAGQPHAEVEALRCWSRKQGTPENDPPPLPPEATVYITLEPCSTQGRTPPCCDALIRAHARRVVVGTRDPNPNHAGRGLDVLRAAGIMVIEGVEAPACEDLNLIFNHAILGDSPFWAGKIATTLDGKIATRNGQSQWITGALARQDVMRWRRLFPAIAVGAQTVLHDNPSLTARPADSPIWCPCRLVFDRHLRTAERPDLTLFQDQWARSRTYVIHSPEALDQRKQQLDSLGITRLPFTDYPTLDAWLMVNGITAVLVEGGQRLLSELIAHGILHYLFAYRAPKLLGDNEAPSFISGRRPVTMSEALELEKVIHTSLGPDQLMRGHLKR